MLFFFYILQTVGYALLVRTFLCYTMLYDTSPFSYLALVRSLMVNYLNYFCYFQDWHKIENFLIFFLIRIIPVCIFILWCIWNFLIFSTFFTFYVYRIYCLIFYVLFHDHLNFYIDVFYKVYYWSIFFPTFILFIFTSWSHDTLLNIRIICTLTSETFSLPTVTCLFL